MKLNKTLNILDLFAGCGGLAEGFEAEGHYRTLAAVEWEKAPRDTLAKRLNEKWHIEDSEARTMLFDMQQADRLFSGWENDEKFGSGIGLDRAVGDRTVDVVIGGPPCQAYSVAGRIRDENGMRNDYRNFLFESYLKVIERYKPRAFVFENVPGLLSAKPTGEPIAPIIAAAFKKAGYVIPTDLKQSLVNMSLYGLPQKRNRLIILGLSEAYFGSKAQERLDDFYRDFLPKYKADHLTTVEDAIGDLPPLYPSAELFEASGRKSSHIPQLCAVSDHYPRFHNMRDISIFKKLAKDIESGRNRYASADALKKLYTEETGHESNIHKYHVLRRNEPSNLIPAHLFKDGLRHIHPDPKQARTLTIREAARLQGFPDDFEFLGSAGDKYKMIGNAVPPYFAKIVAKALYEFLEKSDGAQN